MITIKNKQEIEMLREGGQKLAVILDKLAKMVKPGITPSELEKKACDLIKEVGGRPAFKGYASALDAEPFPTALCVSFNEELVHVPALSSREFQEGDIISIDVGMEYPYSKDKNGYYLCGTCGKTHKGICQKPKDVTQQPSEQGGDTQENG